MTVNEAAKEQVWWVSGKSEIPFISTKSPDLDSVQLEKSLGSGIVSKMTFHFFPSFLLRETKDPAFNNFSIVSKLPFKQWV